MQTNHHCDMVHMVAHVRWRGYRVQTDALAHMAVPRGAPAATQGTHPTHLSHVQDAAAAISCHTTAAHSPHKLHRAVDVGQGGGAIWDGEHHRIHSSPPQEVQQLLSAGRGVGGAEDDHLPGQSFTRHKRAQLHMGCGALGEESHGQTRCAGPGRTPQTVSVRNGKTE